MPANAFTPSREDAFSLPMPSINGLALSKNSARLLPIFGSLLEILSIAPPTKPPIKLPMAPPTASNSLPPSPINQFRPGICSNIPIAVKTADSSAISRPTASTPAIAAPAKKPSAASANNISAKIPIPCNARISNPLSALFKASNTLAKKVSKILTKASTNPGNCFSMARIATSNNLMNLDTKSGPCCKSKSNVLSKNTSTPSTRFGA